MKAEKQCRKCKEIKPLDDFNKDKKAKDGKRSYCKVCIASYKRAYRLTDKGKASHIKSNRKHRQLHPEKIKAGEAVIRAVKSGKLTRPTICSECKQPNGTIQGHHESYAKPMRLVVVWLCRWCHAKRHKAIAVDEPVNDPNQ